MVTVLDNETGKVFRFPNHEEKESFFDLWDEYEVRYGVQ